MPPVRQRLGARLLCILSLLVPAYAAGAERGSFATTGPAGRFQQILRRVEKSAAPRHVGVERWAALVADARPAIEGAADHQTFARQVNQLFSGTGQSHFQYLTADEWLYWYLMSTLERGGSEREVDHIGIWPERIESRWFARGVLESSPAEEAGVRVGDELVAVNGEPFAPIVPFRGKAGQPVELLVRRSPEAELLFEVVPVRETLHAAVRRAMLSSIRMESCGERTLGYAHVWSLLGARDLFQELARRADGMDGLLLDFRDGVGGTWKAANQFLLGSAGSSGFNKPVVVLTADGTRSAKELVVYRARKEGRVLLVGEPTPGAVTEVDRSASGPMGSDGYLILPGRRFSLEGVATEPDFLIRRRLPFSGGTDPQLELARDVLVAWLQTSEPASP